MGICRTPAFLFEEFKHLDELAEDQDFLAFGQERIEQLEKVSVLPEADSLPTRLRVTANLAQPGKGGQHVDLALIEPFLGHGFHDLLAAAAQFGQVKFALFLAQFAIAALLDAIGQIFGRRAS